MYFCKEANVKLKVCFPAFSAIYQVLVIMVHETFDVIKLWQFAQKTVALRQAIFNRKKGFATISLGLIHHSMVLSQPPSVTLSL
jgi:hypothetical protein